MTTEKARKRTSLDRSVDKWMHLEGVAVGILADVKRRKLSSAQYLERRKGMFESEAFKKAPQWVQRKVLAFLQGGIKVIEMFDICFVYTLPDGKTYEVRSPEYNAAVDYSTVKQWENTGRLVWASDFEKVWF